MSVEKIIFSLPVTIEYDEEVDGHNTRGSVIAKCTYLHKKYNINNEIINASDGMAEEGLSMLDLIHTLHKELQERYDTQGYLEEPSKVDDELQSGKTRYNLEVKLELLIKRGSCERLLPKLALISAVATQSLLLVSASISIYVKGVSAPLTIIVVTASGISTLFNFTQSGTTEAVSRIGAYLDYKPIKKCKSNCNKLKHKGLWAGTGIVTLGIWGLTMFGNTVSSFSETEIIDNAGFNAGLRFLTPQLIMAHALAVTVFGGITVGLFSGNFAYRALTNFYDWASIKCYGSSQEEYEDETSQLTSAAFH